MEEIYSACKSGDLENVMLGYRSILSDDILDRLLYIAVNNGHLSIITYLVSIGADPEFDDNWLIGIASENGRLDIVKYLVSQGADVRGHDDYAIIRASDNGHLDVVKYLVSQGSDYSNPIVLMWASASGRLDIVKYITKQQIATQPDINPEIDFYDSLKLASQSGHLNVIEYLLDKGGDWNALIPEHLEYFKAKFAYKKWRKLHLRNWIRKVLIPLYYSPQFQGGIQAKLALEKSLIQNEK